MPQIEEEVIFTAHAEKVYLNTNVNGDTLTFAGLHFSKEQAATLSWLINHPAKTVLKMEMKLQEE